LVVADQDETAAPDEAGPSPRRLGIVAAVAGGVILLDQLTKRWAVSTLADGHVVKVVGSLQFRLAHNPGAAFSVGRDSNLGPLIALLAVVVVAVLIVTGTTTAPPSARCAWGSIAGGALGNILDRTFRQGSGVFGGYVVDFIDPQWWPTFNVADIRGLRGSGGAGALRPAFAHLMLGPA